MHLPTPTALLLAAAALGVRASAGPDLGVGELLAGGSVLFPRQQGQNLQTFTGALGGVKADPITKSGNSERPFEVDGDTFTDFDSAAQRSCDNQKNKCADVVNGGGNPGFKVSDCDQQNTQCKANIKNAATQTGSAQLTLVSSNAEFDFFCES